MFKVKIGQFFNKIFNISRSKLQENLYSQKCKKRQKWTILHQISAKIRQFWILKIGKNGQI